MNRKIVPKALTLALAVSLAANLVVFAVAAGAASGGDYDDLGGPTRKEFFIAVAKSLGLEKEKEYEDVFPDYSGSDEYVNAMISRGFVIGRNNGLLDLDDKLSKEDMSFVLGRLEWPKERVEVEKPVIRTVEVPVMQNLPYSDEALQCEHLFYLAADGKYKCAYESCGIECPVGTWELPSIPSNVLSNLGPDPDETSVSLTCAYGFIDKESFELDDGTMMYFIASNGEFYAGAAAVGMFDFFEQYGSVFGAESYYNIRYHIVESEGVDYIDWMQIIE